MSADADPFTGYEEYFTGFSGNPLELGWGGTSFVAPQLNGPAALIDSLLGHRVGFWNPAIYRFAGDRHGPAAGSSCPLDGLDARARTGTNGDRRRPNVTAGQEVRQ